MAAVSRPIALVSKRNFNREKFGTHKKEKVLRLAGYEMDTDRSRDTYGQSRVMIKGRWYLTSQVILKIKPKPHEVTED